MDVRTSKTDTYWTVRLRECSDADSVESPKWAQRIAQQHSPGARVRLATRTGNRQVVEVVRLNRRTVPSSYHAEQTARAIAEEIEQ